MKIIETLDKIPFETEDEERIYLLRNIQEFFTCDQINKNTWVATIGGGEESFLEFCFLYFNYSNCGVNEDIGVTVLFYGIGNDFLAELRHTYFNEYYFYIDTKSMIDCFSWLEKRFNKY